MWKNNNLSIVIFVLFALSLVGHSCSGWKAHNEEQEDHGKPPIPYSAFLASSEFGETVFENWESEFLQMGVYVIATIFLFQRGSSESKKHDGTDEVDKDPELHRGDAGAPYPVRKGGWLLKVYRHSLSLAFVLLFLISFIGHAWAGARRYNDEQLAHGSAEKFGTLTYMTTAQFWYESLQNWQSEFLAVLAIVTLSIWLRQQGSPESKPVHAPNRETGSG